MLSCSSIGTSPSSLQFSNVGHFDGDTLFGFFWQLSIEHMWNYSFKQLLSIYCVYYPAKIKHLLTEELCNCQLIIYVKFTFDWLHFANKSKWIRFLKDSLCIGVLPAYIYICVTMCMPSAQWNQKRTFGSPGTRVTDGCKLRCSWWKPNLCPLQEQQILSHWATSPAPTFLF